MRRGELLRALRAAGPAGVSGEVLAAEFGVSRVAVGKHVRVLRKLGYEIEAVAGTGYRLVGSPDLPLPEEVAPLVTNPLWTHWEGGFETASTNDDAKRLARAGAPEGSVVLAARQTAGRGRLGREWASPGGGAYLSVVLRPQTSPATVASLPLAVGLGVVRGLEALGIGSPGHAAGVRAMVKWPNDVWLAQASGEPLGKVAGILLEMQAESDLVDWVVVGVGLNVRDLGDGFQGAAYLADHLPGVRTAEAAAAVLDGIASAYAAQHVAGFDALRDEYVRHSMLEGRDVTVRDPDGRVRGSGRVAGIDSDGRLLLDGAEGRTAVSAGDITLRVPGH